MYIPTEEMDKAIKLKRNSPAAQIDARTAADSRGTRVVPPAEARPAPVCAAHTCIASAVHSQVASCSHSTLVVSAFGVSVCTPSCCRLCVCINRSICHSGNTERVRQAKDTDRGGCRAGWAAHIRAPPAVCMSNAWYISHHILCDRLASSHRVVVCYVCTREAPVMQAMNRGGKRQKFNFNPPKANNDVAGASANGAAGSGGYGTTAPAPEFVDNPHIARPVHHVYSCEHTAIRVLQFDVGYILMYIYIYQSTCLVIDLGCYGR